MEIFKERDFFDETFVFSQPRKPGLYISRLYFSSMDIMNTKNYKFWPGQIWN